MSGFDLILEKRVSKIKLQQVIAVCFGIPEKSILITDDYVDSPLTDDIRLWCMANEVDGDFLLVCQFFIRDESIGYCPDLISKKITYILSSKCLIPDTSPSPLTWKMVSPDGTERSIILDSNELDNDRYVIYKE
ncbi:hypothetical protein I2492_13420 [Budviciaceae bacterium CWB-B4]|uniref:Uncharacterized protein n=1 Tax=Limnobaculum xujianqingii TaxID=2738837 RepID=A0A9D7FUT0_9GAMM|nr:hypothetical protein [Limnobaculum xujianqingii]MBK5073788.1 hypothetical protein [Limnobaculum xujianqingii]MBK5177318.1 hypothetical protein [Limnobaculum xujianqingii]